MPLKTDLFAILLFVVLVVSIKENFLSLDTAVPPSTRTLQPRHSLTSSNIDFSSLPECAAFWCSPSDWQGPGLCPSVPCPSTTDTSCTTVDTDCFCNLKYPLHCGWDLCDWSAWYHFENWYNETCPDAKPVDFSGLPTCVRGCLPDQFILYGCITLGRSCVCQSDEFFGCAAKCDTKSNTTIQAWFTELCGNKETVEFDGVAIPTHSGVVQRVRPPTPIRWYETYAVVIAAVSVLVFVVVVVMVAVFDKKHKKMPKLKPKKT